MLTVISLHLSNGQFRLRSDISKVVNDTPHSHISWPRVGGVVTASKEDGDEVGRRRVGTEYAIKNGIATRVCERVTDDRR